MNSLPPEHRGAGSGMNTTFQNSAQVLSIGIFFTLMIVGLSALAASQPLPRALSHHGVPADSGSPGIAPAAGLHPVRRLPWATTRSSTSSAPACCRTRLPPSRPRSTGRSFFPGLISAPSRTGCTPPSTSPSCEPAGGGGLVDSAAGATCTQRPARTGNRRSYSPGAGRARERACGDAVERTTAADRVAGETGPARRVVPAREGATRSSRRGLRDERVLSPRRGRGGHAGADHGGDVHGRDAGAAGCRGRAARGGGLGRRLGAARVRPSVRGIGHPGHGAGSGSGASPPTGWARSPRRAWWSSAGF